MTWLKRQNLNVKTDVKLLYKFVKQVTTVIRD